jgi:predicted nucleic acid-binding protein
MMSDVLLDTTFFIDLHGRDRGAEEVWEAIITGGLSASYSSLSVFELWVGPDFGPVEENFYSRVIQLIEEVPANASAAKWAGLWLRSVQRDVRNRRFRDAMIAASAFVRGEAVVTRNRRDFERFPIRVHEY